MSEVKFLCRLRDALRLAADSVEEYLETLAPAEVKSATWSPEKIQWTPAESASGKGPFEKADPKQGGQDFQNDS